MQDKEEKAHQTQPGLQCQCKGKSKSFDNRKKTTHLLLKIIDIELVKKGAHWFKTLIK